MPKPKQPNVDIHLSLQELLQSVIDDEDYSVAFRSAAVQELDRINHITVVEE